MDTHGNLAFARQTPSSPPSLSERLAVARLQYTVNELQTKVDYDRRITPPVRKTYNCVTDDSALVQSICEFKRWTGEGLVSMIVPLCTLDALDDLKKGTEAINVNSRESIRYFDRCQSGTGRKPVRGVHLQAPGEMFEKWEECNKLIDPEAVVPAMPPPSPPKNSAYYQGNGSGYYANGSGNGNGSGGGGGNDHRRGSRAVGGLGSVATIPITPTPPKWIQPILNCALYKLHPPGKEPCNPSEAEETVLVTNNEAVSAWAKVYGIKAIDSNNLADMIGRDSWEFTEKKRVYDSSTRSAGGGRNGSGGGRGGRGGGRGGGHRREGSKDGNQNHNGGSGRGGGEGYVLRGAPRGVARGRGKLWEP